MEYELWEATKIMWMIKGTVLFFDIVKNIGKLLNLGDF